MQEMMRRLFAPLLDRLEAGEGKYAYRPSHRKILMAVGALFMGLSAAAVYASVVAAQLGGLFPAVVFFLLGLACEVVAFLGSDRAVARIWGGR